MPQGRSCTPSPILFPSSPSLLGIVSLSTYYLLLPASSPPTSPSPHSDQTTSSSLAQTYTPTALKSATTPPPAQRLVATATAISAGKAFRFGSLVGERSAARRSSKSMRQYTDGEPSCVTFERQAGGGKGRGVAHVVKKKAPKKVARRRMRAAVGMAWTGMEGRSGGEVAWRDWRGGVVGKNGVVVD